MKNHVLCMEISTFLLALFMLRYVEISMYPAMKHMARYMEISMYLAVRLVVYTSMVFQN